VSISVIADAELALATCPSCGETMEPSHVEPQLNAGFEVHTLECIKCGHFKSHIVRLCTLSAPGPNAA
jgi:Zn ribbon nucleic-acid-binding protein